MRPENADLEVVPLAAGNRHVANPLHRGALALLELPQHEIVFQAVRLDRQVVAVGLEIEQDAGTLIDPARDTFEADRTLPVPESGTSLATP